MILTYIVFGYENITKIVNKYRLFDAVSMLSSKNLWSMLPTIFKFPKVVGSLF